MKEPNLICSPLQPAIISWPYPIWNYPICFLIKAVICLSLSSIPESIRKECWHGRGSQMHPMSPSFCAEQICSQFWPHIALLNWRHSILADTFQRAGKWLCGYMMLWRVCILIAVSGSRHPDKGPSKWQGEMNSKRSRNTFSPQRTEWVDLWADRPLLMQLEGAWHPFGHTFGTWASSWCQVTVWLKSLDSTTERDTYM